MKKTAEQFLKEKGKKRDFDPNGYCEFDSLVKLLEEFSYQFNPKWISGGFYVVENYQYEEGLINQLSNGFEDLENAIKFLNSDYNKRYHPNAFIMNSVMPLPEKP